MRDKINFLHIHTTDTRGGAAISAYRFHKALLEHGYGSHILCGRKYSFGDDVTPIVPGKYGWAFNKIVGRFFNNLGLQSFGYPSSFFMRFSKWIKEWADVVILRNLHGWYFSIGTLPSIAKYVPIIWRLPDMWALTGHCAYSYDCQRWKIGCGSCPYLNIYPEIPFDTTHFFWLRKKKIYQKIKNRLVFVSPSKWLKRLVDESQLTKDFRCEYIPTGIDLNIFKPGLREESRKILGIQEHEKVIMFSAENLRDKRKGLDTFFEVVKELKKKIKFPITLLLVGCRGERFDFSQDIKLIKIGFTEEDKFLSVCYNVCDVYLCLSKADNLPNTLVEASACGVPIVTLDNGGCVETLENGRSGYVVRNISEIIEAVRNILHDDSKNKEFSINARALAEKKFSMENQVNAYVKLAGELLDLCKE